MYYLMYLIMPSFIKFSVLLLADSFRKLPKLINTQLCVWGQFVFMCLFVCYHGVIYLSSVSAEKDTYFVESDDAVNTFTVKEEIMTVLSLFH